MKNKFLMIGVLTAALAMSSMAFADCGGGNGNGDPPSNGCQPNDPGNGGNGGTGGAGSAGGTTGPITNTNTTGPITVDIGPINAGATAGSESNSTSTSNSDSHASSNSSATGGNATGGTASSNAEGGAGGSVSNSGNSTNANNATTNVTFTDSGKIQYSGSYKVKNVPSVIAPNAYPTAPCTVGYSGGASMVGFGASFGGGKEDKECTRRETARTLSLLGQNDVAVSLMCMNADVAQAWRNTYGTACGTLPPVVTEVKK